MYPVAFVLFLATAAGASVCDTEALQLGKSAFDAGSYESAATYFRAALTDACPSTYINLAAAERALGAFASARTLLGRALALAEGAGLARAANSLGVLEEQQGRWEEAERAYTRALAAVPAGESDLAASIRSNFGKLELQRGRLTAAAPLLEAAWRDRRAPMQAINLAELRRLEQRYAEARELLAAARGLAAPEAPVQAVIANNLAQLAKAAGPRKQVEPLLREALARWERLHGRRHPACATALANLGAWFYESRRYAAAEPFYIEALAIERDAWGGSHPALAIHHNNLAALYQALKRWAEAETHYRAAAAIHEHHPTPRAVHTWGNLGLLYQATGRPADAREAFERLLTLPALPSDEMAVARYLEAYEAQLRRAREPADAERVALQAMRYRVRTALRLR